jgi:hypothetical protein
MNPPRRLGRQLQGQRQHDDNRTDDHRQERRRTVADVEARELQIAGAAAVGELDRSGEQRPLAAPGAETEKGSLAKWRLPSFD